MSTSASTRSAPDGTGELLIRGQNIVSGYWNKPEATAETFVDGWLHSGDLARIDDEGLVYLVDRMKDMINRGGENVYCVEVENALAGAPGVYEAAVLGVPDEMMGEKVGAVIVPMPGASLDVPAVLGYLGDHIADFKVPQYVAVSAHAAAAQPRRQAAQAAAARRRRLGRRLPPLTAKPSSWPARCSSTSPAAAPATPPPAAPTPTPVPQPDPPRVRNRAPARVIVAV